MAKVDVTLQALAGPRTLTAEQLHLRQLKLPQLPRPGDFIKDDAVGYAEVARVVFDVSGKITLVIK